MQKLNIYSEPSLKVLAVAFEENIMIASAGAQVEDYEIDPQEIEW